MRNQLKVRGSVGTARRSPFGDAWRGGDFASTLARARSNCGDVPDFSRATRMNARSSNAGYTKHNR